MFMGLSIRTATLIFNSWSWEPLDTVALYHSGAWNTAKLEKIKIYIALYDLNSFKWKLVET